MKIIVQGDGSLNIHATNPTEHEELGAVLRALLANDVQVQSWPYPSDTGTPFICVPTRKKGEEAP